MLLSFNSSTVREMLVTFAMGRCSLAPADALVTVPVTAAARRSGMTMTVGAGGVGGAQDGSEIVGILDAVEHNDQRILISLGGDYVGKIIVLFCRGDGNHTLMRGVAGHAVELGALQKAHGHADLSAIFDEALQAEVVALFGHADPLERASARLQRLGHRVDAIDVVHEVSVYRGDNAAIRRER